MGKIERFEDLNCWQQARKVVNLVYDVCDTERISKDFTTKDQIKRAALSSMNNIAEGFGRFSNKEFIRFLEISESSAMETRSMLYVLIDRKYINQKTFDEIFNEVIDLTNQVIGFMKYLQTKATTPQKSTSQKINFEFKHLNTLTLRIW